MSNSTSTQVQDLQENSRKFSKTSSRSFSIILRAFPTSTPSLPLPTCVSYQHALANFFYVCFLPARVRKSFSRPSYVPFLPARVRKRFLRAFTTSKRSHPFSTRISYQHPFAKFSDLNPTCVSYQNAFAKFSDCLFHDNPTCSSLTYFRKFSNLASAFFYAHPAYTPYWIPQPGRLATIPRGLFVCPTHTKHTYVLYHAPRAGFF